MLQYVLVKDLQTGSSYYFLAEEWLSVDNERTDGRVEIEVEASGKKLQTNHPNQSICWWYMPFLLTSLFYFLFVSEEAVLLQLPRLLRCELQRALCESHLWLSLWERPPRSPFTRLQRATCCAVLLQLFLLANTLWYSVVVDKRYRYRDVLFSVFSVYLFGLKNKIYQFWWVVPIFVYLLVLQPSGRVEVCFIKRTDGGSRCGDLSGRLPSLPARLHAVQDEPQQGNTTCPKLQHNNGFKYLPKAKHGVEYFLFCVNVCVCKH